MPSSSSTTWTGQASNNNFNAALNWSAGVPTAATDAEIDGSSGAPLTVALASGPDVAKTLTTNFTTLDLSGAALSIVNASTLDALAQSGGVLEFENTTGASSSFTGEVSQTAGTVQVDAASLELAAGGALGGTIDGNGTVLNAGVLAVDGLTAQWTVVLENQGTATLAGGLLTLGDNAQSTATLQNDASGTFDLTGDGGITIGTGATLVSIANAGLLEKSGGTGTSSIAAAFAGAGEVLANSGTLAFLAANTYSGVIDGVGTVAFDGQNNTLGPGATLTVSAVALGGTLDLATDAAYAGVLLSFGNVLALGTNTLTLSNAADNLGGASVIGSGMLANENTLAVDTLTVGGAVVLVNQGTATLAGGTLALGDGLGSTATLRNASGGVFDLTGDGSVTGGSIDGRPGVAIVNAGILEKNGGTGTSDIDAAFSGGGIVFANSGVLAFLNSNSYAGTIAGTGAVALDGNTNTLTAGLVLAVPTLEAGGTLVFQADLAFAGLLLASAQHLSLGTHTLTLSHAGDDLLNTRVDGTGTLKSTTTLAVDGLVLNGGVLFDNAGTAILGNAAMQIGDSATSTAGLLNEAGAVFDLTGNTDILGGSSNLAPDTFITNAGLFEMTGGVGSGVAPAFSNTGTVLAQTGVLTFAGGGTFGGTIAGGGLVALAGTSDTLTAGVALTVATLVAAGQLTFEGDLSYSNDLVAPGTLLLNGHTLTLNNGIDNIIGASVLGGGTLVNQSTLVVDAVTAGGSVALVNDGTALLVGSALTLGDSAGSTASLFNAAGATLEMLSGGSIEGGAAFNHPHVSMVNEGLLHAGGGQFDVFAPFSSAGTVLVTVAGLTLHAAGDLSGDMLGGGIWDTTGTIDFAAGGALATDGAQITLDSGGSALLSTPIGSAGPVALETTLTSITAGGVLSLLNGRSFAGTQAISDNGKLVLDGGTFAAASFTMESSATLTGFGTVMPTILGGALIEAFGGALVLNGGTGFAVIEPAATLELAAAFSGIVEFATGGTATVALDAPGDFTGTIDSLAVGDTIDFRNTQVSRASFAGSTLLVTVGAATTTYDLGAPITGVGLIVQSDASGTGSDVVLSSASFAPAVAQVNTPSPVDFGNLRMGAAGQTTLSVTNAATAPAEGLDATVTPGGSATGHGSFDLLAAGQTDSTDLIAGLTATVPGVASGSVVLGFFSDGNGTSGNGTTALPSQTLAVTGTFYGLASAAFAAPSIVHVSGSGSFDLAVENVATPLAFAEGLRAQIVGASGSIDASGATGLIAAGSTDTSSLSLVLPTTAGIVSGFVTLDTESDGSGTSGLGLLDLGDQTIPVTVTVDNFAVATIEKTSGAGSLVQNGNTYTLDFATVTLGAAAQTVDLDVLNSAAGPADLLSGTFAVGGGISFTDNGFSKFAGVTAGTAGGASSIVFTPGTAGAYSETITLAPTGSNGSGFAGALADETLVVAGTVAAATVLAQPMVNTDSPINLGGVREGTTASAPLSVSNVAPAGAESLDVTAAAGGGANVAGTITRLAPGGTDASSVVAGIDTDTAGVAQGTVMLAFASDNGSGTVTPLTGQDATLDLTGTVYAEAAFAAATPAPVLLHVGDSGAGTITVLNTAPAPFAENLDVGIASASGLGASAAGLGPIAPQSSGEVAYTIDTTHAGIINGKVGLDFSSDGTGIDSAGPTPIGTQTIAVTATINNYATAALAATKGVLTQNGGNYTLDLGTVGLGAGPQTADLLVVNSAAGPADVLSGTLTAGSNNGFIESGAAPKFSNLFAGGSVDLEQLTLDPTALGTFDATFTLAATGANASGFSAPVAGATVTVQETVGTGPGIFATVLGAGGGTVTIPFTTVANAVAAQIALNVISNAVRAGTFTQLDYDGSTAQTAATPQFGLVELDASTVPMAPLALAGAAVSAVLNGAAPQAVSTGLVGNDTVVSGSAGAAVANLGANAKVFFGGGGNQQFVETNFGPFGPAPSADVWLDGNGTFDDSGGATRVHIATVPGGASAVATTLTVIDNGAGTTTIDIGSDTTGFAESDSLTFQGTGSAATTVNAAGTAGAGGAVGGVPLTAYVGTGSGFINGNGSNVTLFGGSTGAVTLLGGAGTDVDAGAGGLIEAGTGGGSRLFGSTVPGSTTLVGGANGDLLSADGRNTVLIAGAGNESLYAFQPATLRGFAGAQAPGATTLFQAATGGNTYLPGSGRTSIASVVDSNGGNLFQESVSGSANAATISGFVSGLDSISGVNPAGGDYALVTNRAPGPQEMSLSVSGSTSTLTFGDGTTWTFNAVVQVSDFINVASRGGV